MSDIVERLRETASCADYVVDREIAAEAADTITRLTAEVEKLKKEIIGRQAHDHMQVREIKRLTAERNKLRAYALKSFTVVEFCCGEGFLLSYPHYDCDDLIMEGVDLLRVESSDEARAALSGDKQ